MLIIKRIGSYLLVLVLVSINATTLLYMGNLIINQHITIDISNAHLFKYSFIDIFLGSALPFYAILYSMYITVIIFFKIQDLSKKIIISISIYLLITILLSSFAGPGGTFSLYIIKNFIALFLSTIGIPLFEQKLLTIKNKDNPN